MSHDVGYTFTMGYAERTLFAAFAESDNGVWEWEGTLDNKTLVWRSRRNVSAQPINLSSASVYADGYPVELTVAYASSPDPAENGFNETSIEISNQDPRRLPTARPEKYIEVEVISGHAVTKVAVGSSMMGLING